MASHRFDECGAIIPGRVQLNFECTLHFGRPGPSCGKSAIVMMGLQPCYEQIHQSCEELGSFVDSPVLNEGANYN